MEIKPDRMVYLGYGKYWRSDAILGLMPIEEDRGPGRRTEVYTSNLAEPIIASRSEQAILQDMALATEEQFRVQEIREVLVDLLDALEGFPDVLDRMLVTEARFDVAAWTRRLKVLLGTETARSTGDQSDLFVR